MRAGKLDKTIIIQRRGEVVDEYGTVTEGWTSLATVRAQIIKQTTEEFLQNAGTSEKIASVFRIRHMNGLTTADRVTCDGKIFDLKEIKELGRREGLDLRCTAAGG